MPSLLILVRSVFFSTLMAIIAAVLVAVWAALPARGDLVFTGSDSSPDSILAAPEPAADGWAARRRA